jgi:glycosyltransferase involved in cell wall biosynthesis
MHIAYVHYLIEEDTGRHHAAQFAEAARSLGHRVDVHAMNFASSAPAGASRRAVLRSLLKGRLSYWLHEPKEILWNPLYVRREIRLLQDARPEVLLVRDHLLTASCVSVARRLGIPLVLEFNAPAEESGLYLREYMHLPWVGRTLERYKVRRADALTVVSTTLKSLMVRNYKVNPERVTVVPNGADLSRFRPDAIPDPEVTWPAGAGPVIGFVGSFRTWHGTGMLAAMVREIARARPATCFLLVGDGPELAAVRAALGSLGPRVRFTGRVPHGRVPGLTAAFDIGVLPETLFYGSPLKVVEWMAAGRGIVAPGYAALADIVEDGAHALTFRPGDAGEFTRAVLRLVDDAGLRSRLGRAAALKASTSLSWADNARRVVGACHQAVLRRAGRDSTTSPGGSGRTAVQA